ncbi:MAG: FAD-binding oxidoreductase, partial [Kiritimatiellae bacterium]|nr:FAD-binding oxidoreductase [Kiritimatiellia bacterium]
MNLQIIGHGIAGALLAEIASQNGIRVSVWADDSPASSRVAAGLFTPVTGQRLSLSWRADDALPEVDRFYPDLEEGLGCKFFHPLPTLRVFTSEKQRREWEEKPKADCVHPLNLTEPRLQASLRTPWGVVYIEGGGWVDLPVLLDALEQRRKSRNEWGRNPKPDLTVHATGHQAARDPLWKAVGWRNAHGDVLTVKIPGLPTDFIYSFDKFLLPLGEDRFRFGATYHWDVDDPVPQPDGRTELEASLKNTLALPYEIQDHQAGIRPVAIARVPIIGPHPEQPDQWIFTGFGSKGVLYTPWLAQRLVDHWQTQRPLPKETQSLRRIQRQR